MQVSVESLGKFERKLTVTMPRDALQQRVQQRVQELCRTLRLKGFRPGKVPPKVVEQRYGNEIRDEVHRDLVRDAFDRAIDENALRLAGQPTVDLAPLAADGPIEFTARFEVLPELPPVDVTALEIERVESEVTEADVDAMIETLRQQRRQWVDSDQPAADGDLVLFELSAEFDGGRYPAEGAERLGTILGSGVLTQALDQALLGLVKDGEKTADVSFPEDFRIEALAGRSARCQLKVLRLQRAVLPEVDAAFMAQFGIVEGGLERFRSEVAANLRREMNGALEARLKAEVADKLVQAYPIELPQGMVRDEAIALYQRANTRDGQVPPVPSDEVLEPFREPARRRLLAGLLFSEIARVQNLRVDLRRVGERIDTIASTYEQPEQVKALYRKDQQLLAGVHAQVLEEQVALYVAEHARCTTRKIPFAELMKR